MDNRQPKRLHFGKEIPTLMYGGGDVEYPLQESVEVMEGILMDFLFDVCSKACDFSNKENRRLKLDDFKKALNNDDKKLARIEELLYMNEVISRAKMLFDQEEVKD
ncbi:transcription initiation factor IID, 18 kDa subunit [Neoconidiobolus thromboides FSU 785]|nr:transcription initiation factor IID, 18 kDa subunit [Neoconidiobolus thromboides FSU 785]